MSEIKMTLHCGSIFAGSYYLTNVNWIEGNSRPEIIAYFDPIAAKCSFECAKEAADWLVENRTDMRRVSVEVDGGAFTYEATK